MSVIRSYKQLRESIQWDKEFCDFLLNHGMTPEEVANVKADQQKKQKEQAREFYQYQRKYCVDPLSVPVRNNVKEWRTVGDDDGEGATDFIIIPDRWGDLWESEDEDDYQTIADDIEEFVFSTVGYRSGYDFPTGKMITLSWYFTRTPCGVAIIHRRGIDW